MDIEWQEGAVCFANGKQWRCDGATLRSNPVETATLAWAIRRGDFQLNTIKQGDYIEASEFDTEKMYNDAVEVFGLFGFEWGKTATNSYDDVISMGSLTICHDGIFTTEVTPKWCARKLTYPQLMAIGELKRLQIEREKSSNSEKPNSCEYVVNKQEVKMQKNKPVVAQVMVDLTERMEIGIKTYGEALRANNGRDALQDAYEEALDLACYLKQAMIERDNENTN